MSRLSSCSAHLRTRQCRRPTPQEENEWLTYVVWFSLRLPASAPHCSRAHLPATDQCGSPHHYISLCQCGERDRFFCQQRGEMFRKCPVLVLAQSTGGPSGQAIFYANAAAIPRICGIVA